MDFGLGGLLKNKKKSKKDRKSEGMGDRDRGMRVRFGGVGEENCGNMIVIHYMKI